MRILLSEDHECVRWGIKGMLSHSFKDITFGEASNSRETVDLFYKESWDCVLMDIDLPGRSGLDLLEEFTRAKPTVPILILSGCPEETYSVRAIKSGARGFVTKTSAHKEITTAIQRVLSGKKYISSDLAEYLADMVHSEVPKAPHEVLSNREFQVMRLIAAGRTTSQIAEELSLSEQSVSTYRSRMLEKLGFSNTAEIVRYALEHQIIP